MVVCFLYCNEIVNRALQVTIIDLFKISHIIIAKRGRQVTITVPLNISLLLYFIVNCRTFVEITL